MSTQSQKQGSGAFFGIPAFWKVQMNDWKVTVTRTSLERLGYQIIYPYLSLYIVALGAKKTQLGIITSIGMLISAFLGPITGKLIDQRGAKSVYIAGIVGLLASYMIYASAKNWYWAVAAMIIYYIGAGTSGHSCGTICGNCLKNCDRAKGMLICESLAAGLLGMLGPQLAVFLLVRVIGANPAAATAHDYHYLFYVSAFFTFISLIVVVTKLSNAKVFSAPQNSTGSVMKDGMNLLKSNQNARKWIVASAIGTCAQSMILPYVQVYAGEVKMASVAVLGTMVTASALTSTCCGYFIGVIADKVGRKKVLYVVWPLYWLSIILLMIAKSPAMLIASGVLQGFFYISAPLGGAIAREIVDQNVMGTWLGITRLTGSLTSAVMAVLSGIIYDNLGPNVLFILFICMEAFIRMPLLISMPETLKKESA